MGDKQIVVAIFPDEAAADTAAQSLKDWDKLDDDVKLNAIGILVLVAAWLPTNAANAAPSS